MAEIQFISRCCKSAFAGLPEKVAVPATFWCLNCGEEYEWHGFYVCLDSGHDVTKSQTKCAKCPATVFIPALVKPDRSRRCAVCKIAIHAIQSLGRGPCLSARDVENRCPGHAENKRQWWLSNGKNGEAIPRFVVCAPSGERRLDGSTIWSYAAANEEFVDSLLRR